MLFMAIDDHARIAFTAMHPDEKTPQAVRFLRDAVAYYAGREHQTAAHRQRLGVSLARIRTGLPGAGYRAQIHQGLPTTNQWQGRTLHPVSSARVGLRVDLPELGAPHTGPGQLAALLQLAPPTQWHRRMASHVQTQLIKKQPLDSSQTQSGQRVVQFRHPIEDPCSVELESRAWKRCFSDLNAAKPFTA